MRRFVLVFFDDILVYSRIWEEHQEHLATVLEVLRKERLFANWKKCSFGQQRLEYLGHVISLAGVAVDPAKVEAILLWPTPKNVRGVRGFLGLVGYYWRFVRNFGHLARPLTDLLKRGEFKWTNEATDAFEALQQATTTLPVLAMPDFAKPLVVETNASGSGLGVVLMQQGRPIAYLSKALSGTTRFCSVYGCELMAVVLAVQKWRHYLLGRHFVARTDQQSLRFLMDQWLLPPEHLCWAIKFFGYDFELQYKQGASNRIADALS